MRRRTLLGLIPAAALAVRPLAANPVGGGATDPSIVLGILGTLTGPGAWPGQDAVDGFQLALRQMGGRIANQEVRVVIADDEGAPDQAAAQARRLIERERLDMVLTALGPSSLASVLPELLKARLFVINLTTKPAALGAGQCDPFLFDVAAPEDGAHEALGQHLAIEQARRLMVIGPRIGRTAEAVAALKRTFPGEVIEILAPRPGQAVYDEEIRAIKVQKPDAVYSLLTGGMAVAFIQAFHKAGLKAELPLYSVWSAIERPTLAAMDDAALDVSGISTWAPDADMPSARRLSHDFESEHGRPATSWSAQGYDAALLIDAALKTTQGRTANSEAVRLGLRKAEFISVRGGFRFNTNHTPVLSYHLRKVTRDAKGRLAHETRATLFKDWRDRNAPSCPMRWEEVLPVTGPSAPRR